MKPAQFKYIAAHSLEEALELKAKHGDEAKFLAGGQSLMPIMNFRLAQPAVLIDINPLGGLDQVQQQAGGGLRIGALTRYRTLERDPVVALHQPLLHETVPHIAHPQIRNRGTLGGNMAHADPASELPAVVVALDGRMRVQSKHTERWIESHQFFLGALTTALRVDEMLVEVELPEPMPRTGSCFMEVARRRGDFAIMGVAATVTLDEDGTCTHARLAYCNAADCPVNAVEAAQSLVGRLIIDRDIHDAAALAQNKINPLGSIHASKEYQRHLVGVLTRRALRTAADRAFLAQ